MREPSRAPTLAHLFQPVRTQPESMNEFSLVAEFSLEGSASVRSELINSLGTLVGTRDTGMEDLLLLQDLLLPV